MCLQELAGVHFVYQFLAGELRRSATTSLTYIYQLIMMNEPLIASSSQQHARLQPTNTELTGEIHTAQPGGGAFQHQCEISPPPPPRSSPRGAEQPGGSCQPSQAAKRRVRGQRLIPETEHRLGDSRARRRACRSRTHSFIRDRRERERGGGEGEEGEGEKCREDDEGDKENRIITRRGEKAERRNKFRDDR